MESHPQPRITLRHSHLTRTPRSATWNNFPSQIPRLHAPNPQNTNNPATHCIFIKWAARTRQTRNRLHDSFTHPAVWLPVPLSRYNTPRMSLNASEEFYASHPTPRRLRTHA